MHIMSLEALEMGSGSNLSSFSSLTAVSYTASRALEPTVAVLVPCYNEAAAIKQVISDFKAYLPTANVYVYDNGSSDNTSDIAEFAGATVRREDLRGKGNVVRRMFADIEADIFILVDGDGTYDAASAPMMVERLIRDDLDMVNAARVARTESVFRPGHRFGNKVLSGLVATVFGSRLSDMLSGYRVMSRRFVKSFPALSSGFEIETELTVHALELRLPIVEVPTPYTERGNNSSSKLNTWGDGWRILRTIVRLVKEERPLSFFTWVASLLAVVSVALGWPILDHYLVTGEVPRLPTAVLAMGMMIMATLALMAGLILDSVALGRREVKRLLYLSKINRDWSGRRDPNPADKAEF